MKKKLIRFQKNILIILAIILFPSTLSAQYTDNFNSKSISYDTNSINGWSFRTGDGLAEMNFSQSNIDYATINVDATNDNENIWWAFIGRCVSYNMDLSLLNKPNYEFRIEARIKISSAPKRVNLHLNTQRTTDFHSHLMEYDIPDTSNWHTISMTTTNFDAVPGDTVYGQMALMDWGLGNYKVDLDYFKVDIVNVDSVGPDKGIKLPYHPPVPSVEIFSNHILINQDATIDLKYSDLNFNNWSSQDNNSRTTLLSVSGTQYVIMKWDISEFKGKKVDGSGLLELTTFSLERSPAYKKDFGMIRVSEILGGEQNWDQKEVTFNNFCAGQSLDNVINSQMIIDVEVNKERNSKNFITISNPVLQRIIDGKTFGLAIRPLGAIHTSFYAIENNNEQIAARLHFNIKNELSNTGSNK